MEQMDVRPHIPIPMVLEPTRLTWGSLCWRLAHSHPLLRSPLTLRWPQGADVPQPLSNLFLLPAHSLTSGPPSCLGKHKMGTF